MIPLVIIGVVGLGLVALHKMAAPAPIAAPPAPPPAPSLGRVLLGGGISAAGNIERMIIDGNMRARNNAQNDFDAAATVTRDAAGSYRDTAASAKNNMLAGVTRAYNADRGVVKSTKTGAAVVNKADQAANDAKNAAKTAADQLDDNAARLVNKLPGF